MAGVEGRRDETERARHSGSQHVTGEGKAAHLVSL